jgi:hypothetical protein
MKAILTILALTMLVGCGSQFQGSTVYVTQAEPHRRILLVAGDSYEFKRALPEGTVISRGTLVTGAAYTFTPDGGSPFECDATEAGNELTLVCAEGTYELVIQ